MVGLVSTTLAGDAAGCCPRLAAPRFRTSEFTIEDDAVRQVDCTQVFQSELFFVDGNHSSPQRGRGIKAFVKEMLQHQKITFA
jgi:hypothetical protein